MNKKWLQLLSWLAYGSAILLGAAALFNLVLWLRAERGNHEPVNELLQLFFSFGSGAGGWFAGR